MDAKEESEEKAGKENNEVEDLEEEKKKMVNVTDPGLVEKGTGDSNGVVSDFLMSKKEVKWCKALLGLRIATFVFCLNAFSVLAAANQKVLDEIPLLMPTYQFSAQTQYSFHWYQYAEFKYSFAANVIGFVYSVFQICGLLRYLITKKHTVNPKLQGYFNVAMDQVLAFVLMSASSTAATRASIYKSHWVEHGGRKFIDMASASVALSFLAFVAFALSSLVSGFILCRFNK